MGRQGTWRQSMASLVVSVLVLLTFRWIVFEPYVIPSGSMLPTLKILDFIYVNKFAYGLRLPFSSTWLFERSLPERCDVVVFRSQTESGIFLVKRVIGLPGERVELLESGRVRINDKVLQTVKLEVDDEFTTYRESCDPDVVSKEVHPREHAVRLANELSELEVDPIVYSVVVPEGQLVMFGDNRHESADSRVWGTLPRAELLGRAEGIWLSCESALPEMPRLCNPATIRFDRMFRDFDQVAR